MTSKQSETKNKIVTSCQNCVFSIQEGKTQVGCKWDRLEQTSYIEAYNDDGEFYVIDGICNLRREEEVDEEKFNEELALSFLVIINANAIPNIKLKKLNIEYDYSQKLNIHIIGNPVNKKEILSLKDRLKCTAHITPYSDYVIDRIIGSNKASYVCVAGDTQNIDLNYVNNKLNKKHKKPVYEKFQGCTYVSHLAYHVLFTGTSNKNYSENVHIMSKELELNPCLEEKLV